MTMLMLVCTKCQCPSDTSIGNNVGMMRVYILLAVAVVVLALSRRANFRMETGNTPPTLCQTNSLQKWTR
jgi:hypothetical protein